MASEEGIRLRAIRTKVADTDATTAGRDAYDGEIGQEMEPVTPAGRMFMQPNLSCCIVCIIGFKNGINVAAMKKGLEETIVQHKRFSSVMKQDENGSKYWVRTKVNIDDHIVVPPASAINPESSNKIEDYAAELALALPFDQSRPLWELHILNVKSADAAASAIFRIHHSLGDGISIMSLFLASTRSVSNPISLPSVQPLSTEGFNSNERRAGSMYYYFSLFRWTCITIWCTLVEVGKFLLLLLGVKDSQTALKGSIGVGRLAKSISTANIGLDDMRIVKNAVGGTVNDVFLGIVSSGIRRYLQQHADKLAIHSSNNQGNHPVYGGTKEAVAARISIQDKCIDVLRIRATSLVNTRTQPGLPGGSQARWGNSIGYVLTPLCMKKHDDPLDYVRKAKETIDRKKCSLEAIFTYWSAQLILKLVGAEAAVNMSYNALVHTTLALSNMIGPLEEAMFFGNPITDIVPTVFGQPQALCIHLQSYMGKAKLVVTVAKDIIPDPDILLQHIVYSLEDMKQAACARTH
ncbi:hypothetical protein O6H91_16G061500 [Diphasiastrum complanatum]|uniref:Uncharacterized protein n=1 Tax=Diphasiastrum complanatum TaxID=34168 RepID=A0ACC2BCS1_DIPCM|nr:hypothetical protein O6H91_16G061500 [Diphasiastrum complanatum]